ncbi:MAG TPA: hypothetical protein VF185_04835 [Patescibacteria group bacterium]
MKIGTADDEYETKPVHHLIKKYLKLINLTPKEFWESKEIPIVNLRFIFLAAIHNFNSNIITLDDLSTIANVLYWPSSTNKWANPSKFDEIDYELANLLMWTSELTFYNWQEQKNKKSKKTSKVILKDIKIYYEKHKEVIKPYLK